MTKAELNKVKDVTWTEKEEKCFKEKRTKAYLLFKYLASSPSCNDIGLSTFIQKLLNRNRTGEMRVKSVYSRITCLIDIWKEEDSH